MDLENFLSAQSDDPFDPTPMLILADHLEECGDDVGAGIFRSLVSSEIPSLHMIAIQCDSRALDESIVFMGWNLSHNNYGYDMDGGEGLHDGWGIGIGMRDSEDESEFDFSAPTPPAFEIVDEVSHYDETWLNSIRFDT